LHDIIKSNYMKNLFSKTLLVVVLFVTTISISSCITFQDMRKPHHHNHGQQKKKHPNATRVEYKVKTPNHSNGHGKGHGNGHNKGKGKGHGKH